MNMGSSPDGGDTRGLVALSSPLRIEEVPSVEENGVSSLYIYIHLQMAVTRGVLLPCALLCVLRRVPKCGGKWY